MRRLILIFSMLLSLSAAHAQIRMQYVISALGGSASNSTGDAAYTAGEMTLVSTFTHGGYMLSQGFHQMPPSVLFRPTTALPVTLLDFSGTADHGVNHLTWQTASEIGNDHFDIERADEKIQFEKIGSIKGAGNSNTLLNYYYDDKTAPAGANYYRLRQVDIDQQPAYSDIIVITTSVGVASLSIFPNPVRDQMTVVINAHETVSGTLTLTDVVGNMIYQRAITADDGQGLIYIPLHDYSAGQYVLICTTSTATQIVKVVKQ